MEDDFELCDIAGGYLAEAMDTVPPSKVDQMLADWAKGYLEEDVDDAQFEVMAAISLDACLFTPSMSGATPMSRYIASVKTDDPKSMRALQILSRSELRAVRIGRRIDPDRIELADLLSGEKLVLIDAEFIDESEGFDALMRLCRLDSGRYLLMSYPFALTESSRAILDTFVRPGKGIGNAYRCACAVYKHAIREGITEIPAREPTDAEIAEAAGAQVEAAASMLDAEWAIARDDPEARAEFMEELSGIADVDSILSYLQMYSMAMEGRISVPPGNLAEMCLVMIGALVKRKQDGSAEASETLDEVRRIIVESVEHGELHSQCKVMIDAFFADG